MADDGALQDLARLLDCTSAPTCQVLSFVIYLMLDFLPPHYGFKLHRSFYLCLSFSGTATHEATHRAVAFHKAKSMAQLRF